MSNSPGFSSPPPSLEGLSNSHRTPNHNRQLSAADSLVLVRSLQARSLPWLRAKIAPPKGSAGWRICPLLRGFVKARIYSFFGSPLARPLGPHICCPAACAPLRNEPPACRNLGCLLGFQGAALLAAGSSSRGCCVRLSDIEPLFVCQACDYRSADVRPIVRDEV